jgi:hypothetical protein
MPFVPMAYAVNGNVASSTEYNKVVDNVLDLDSRVSGLSLTRPYVHLYQSNTGTQSVANTTATAITFDAEVIDNPSGTGFHSTVSNISRVIPTVAGRYFLVGGVCFPAAGTGSFLAQFRKNGAVVLGAAPYQDKQLYTSGFVALTAQCHATLTANGTTDYFELWTNQNSGGSLSTFSNTTDQHSFLIAFYLGAS